jgi:hypothetical protein
MRLADQYARVDVRARAEQCPVRADVHARARTAPSTRGRVLARVCRYAVRTGVPVRAKAFRSTQKLPVDFVICGG